MRAHAILAASDPRARTDALFALLMSRGTARYDERVTQLEHALQAAALAREEARGDAFVVACLLHDTGHLLEDELRATARTRDLQHEVLGADLLAAWLPTAVTAPVRDHVLAKRYLCGTAPDYAADLSPASVRSLALQGGPLPADAQADARARPHFAASLALRRIDDRAKVVGLAVPPLATYRDAVLGLMGD